MWRLLILSFIFQLKSDFIQLLKETSDIDRHSRWSEIKRKIDSDSRYKAVDSSSRREDWFKDYVRKLEDKRDKDKDKDKDKERDRDKDRDKDREKDEVSGQTDLLYCVKRKSEIS